MENLLSAAVGLHCGMAQEAKPTDHTHLTVAGVGMAGMVTAHLEMIRFTPGGM